MTNYVPEGWVLTTIQELVNSNSLYKDGDWVETKDQDIHGKNRLIQLADIGDGKFINKSNRFLNDKQFTELECEELQPEDILIARMPEPLGRACIFPKNMPRCATVLDITILRTKNANPYWLTSMINSDPFRDKISHYAHGTTRQRVSRNDVAKIPFYIPPKGEQNKIAEFLISIDKIIAASQDYLNKIILLKNTIIESMFSNPKFGTITLVELLENTKHAMRSGPFGSALKKNELVSSGVPYLGIDNIQQEKFIYDFKRYVTQEIFEKFKKYAVKEDDVIITIMGTIGRSCLVPKNIGDALSSKHLWTMTINKKLYLPELICWQFNHAPWILSNFQKNKQGSIMAALTSEALKKIAFPFPPMKEQLKIAKIYHQFNDTIMQKELYVNKLKLMRKAMTEDILSGKIRI